MAALAVARRFEWILVVTLVVADQITKALVRRALELHESIPVIPDLLALTRVHNTGAAFGMFNSMDFPAKTLLLTVVASLALLYLWKSKLNILAVLPVAALVGWLAFA